MTNPSEKVATADEPTAVKRWTIPMLVGDERRDIDGVTEFVPTGVAAAGQVQEPGDDETAEEDDDEGGGLATAIMVSVVLWSVALGIFFTRRRNAKAAAAAPPGPTSTGSEAAGGPARAPHEVDAQAAPLAHSVSPGSSGSA